MQTHICQSSTVNVPYIIKKIDVVAGKDAYGNPAVGMCTKVEAQACTNKTTTCCGMDFSKVEVIMNMGCKSDVRKITINGKEVPYSWSFYNGFTALKFVNLKE